MGLIDLSNDFPISKTLNYLNAASIGPVPKPVIEFSTKFAADIAKGGTKTLDEEKEDMVRFVVDIREERDTTVVLIEHDLGVVMDISDEIYVLDFGELIGSGKPEEIAENPKVIEAYIGEE